MEQKVRELNSPIFALCIVKNIVLVASGGGNKKFGIRNKIISFRAGSGGVSNELFSIDLENDVPTFIEPDNKNDLFAACMNNVTLFYKLTPKDGQFAQIYKLQTLDDFSEDKYQSCIKIENDLIATGTSTGELKLFKFTYKDGKITSCEQICENLTAHSRIIYNIIILPKKSLILTASGDGTVKLFEINKEKGFVFLKKISFRTNISETSNYFMRDMFYDSNENYLYTLQSHLKGRSYMTKWNVSTNFTPIETIIVSENVCSSMKYNKNCNGFGVTGCDGSVYFVDKNGDMSIKRVKLGENMIKCGMFYGKNFITGSTDNYLRVTSYKKKGCLSLFGLIKFIIFLLIVFRILFIDLKLNKIKLGNYIE